MNLRKNLIYINILILSLFFLKSSIIAGQTVSEEVKNAFQTASAGKLSSYFGSTVTLNIPGTDSQFTKEDARNEMHKFFTGHRVKNFEIKFKGEKNNSNFIIGTLYTNKGTYRVNIFFKKTEGNNHIHLLRIDKEHGSKF